MVLRSMCVVTVAALALCTGAAQANGIANGGFENTAPISPLPPGGATSFAANWLSAPTGFPAALSNDAHSGAHSALLSVPGGFGGSTMFQNSSDQGGLPDLVPGLTPILTFWAKGDASETGNALFALRYLDGIGNILYSSGNVFFHTAINPSTWSQITLAGGVIPVGAKAAFLEINTAVGPILNNRPNAILIDDINLSPVPEPESYALMLAGLGLVGMIARRRRSV